MGINKKKLNMHQKQAIKGFMFVLPATIFFVIFTLIPILHSIYLSFTYYDGVADATWNGLNNYKNIFRLDSVFKKSFVNVIIYAAMAVPLSIILPLLYAILVNQRLKGTKVYRAIYYLPGLTSAVAAATVFRLIFNPEIGAINSFLSLFGITGPMWLESTKTSMLSIVILVMWMGIGGNMIIYSAALNGIPAELFEAARIDGAKKLRIFLRITLPLLLPTTFFIMTMSIIGAFQLYDQILILTNGNPANSTVTPVFAIYNRAFGANSNMGYASAQAVLLFLLIMAITLIMQKIVKEIAY